MLYCIIMAACNVIYVSSVDVESLTGAVAVTKAIERTFTTSQILPTTTVVHFKVTTQGVTLTDNKRRSVLTLPRRISSVICKLVDNVAVMISHWIDVLLEVDFDISVEVCILLYLPFSGTIFCYLLSDNLIETRVQLVIVGFRCLQR